MQFDFNYSYSSNIAPYGHLTSLSFPQCPLKEIGSNSFSSWDTVLSHGHCPTKVSYNTIEISDPLKPESGIQAETIDLKLEVKEVRPHPLCNQRLMQEGVVGYVTLPFAVAIQPCNTRRLVSLLLLMMMLSLTHTPGHNKREGSKVHDHVITKDKIETMELKQNGTTYGDRTKICQFLTTGCF